MSLGELLRRRVRTAVVVDGGWGGEGGCFGGLLEDMRRAQARLDCAFLPVGPLHFIPVHLPPVGPLHFIPVRFTASR